MRKPGNVVWEFSEPPDLTVGSGATAAERLLVYATSSLAALTYLVLWYFDVYPWAWWHYVVCAFFAFDIAGGAIANVTNAGKRFFHTAIKDGDPGVVRFFKSDVNFALLHVHTIVLALLIPDVSLFAGVAWYIGLLAGVLTVMSVPLYLQRPIAFLFIVLAIIVHRYFLPLGSGLEWVVPLIFIKIVYGHTVQEEPYRPPEGDGQPGAPQNAGGASG